MNKSIHQMRDPIQYPNLSLKPLVDYIKAYFGTRTNCRMLEIGSYQGESLEAFIGTGLFKRVYAIDPWVNGFSAVDPTSWICDMSEVEKNFDERMSPYPVVDKLKGLSTDFVHLFPDRIFDFIYIDGNHHYEFAKQDLDLYWPKMKIGGLFAGHDYTGLHYDDKKQPWWVGVPQAIDEKFGGPDATFPDDSWVIWVKEGRAKK